MAKHKSKTNAALDKLRRKRSAAIKAVVKANAALDTHLKYRDSPDLPVKFEKLAAAALEGQEYGLAIELNNLCYLDEEVAANMARSRSSNVPKLNWPPVKRVPR